MSRLFLGGLVGLFLASFSWAYFAGEEDSPRHPESRLKDSRFGQAAFSKSARGMGVRQPFRTNKESLDVDREVILAAARRSGPVDFDSLAPSVQTWIEHNPQGLFDLYLELSAQGANRWVVEFIAEKLARTWGANDAEAALLAAEQISQWSTRQTFCANIIRGLGTQKPYEALQLLTSRSEINRPHREDLEYEIYQSWARQDPSQAYQVASLEAHSGERALILTNIARIYGETSPKEAFKWAQSISDPFGRKRALIYSIRGISRVDHEEALAHCSLIEEDDPILASQMKSQVIEELSLYRHEEAWPLIEKMSDGHGKSAAIERLSAKRAAEKPEETLTWSLSLADSHTREKAVVAAIQTWSLTDPQAAVEFVRNEGHDSIPISLLETLALELKNHDAEAAVDFLSSLEDQESITDETKSELVAGFLHSSEEDVLERLAEWPEGFRDSDVLEGAISEWVFKTESGLTDVLATVETMPIDPEAYTSVAANVTEKDVAIAAEWISTMESAEHRDRAIQGMLTVLTERAPVEASQWALEIGDQALRQQYLLESLAFAHEQTSEQAEEIFSQPGLSEEDRLFLEENFRP